MVRLFAAASGSQGSGDRPKMDDTFPEDERMKLTMDFLFVTSSFSGPRKQNNRFRSYAGNDGGVGGWGVGGFADGSWLLLKKLIGGGKWVEWGRGRGWSCRVAATAA